MPTGAIIAFEIGYAAIFLLMFLPPILILLTSKKASLWKWIWAGIAAAPSIIALSNSYNGPPDTIVIEAAWLMYCAFLYASRRRASPEPIKRRRMFLPIASVGLTALLAYHGTTFVLKIEGDMKAHLLNWPMDEQGAEWVKLRIPPGYVYSPPQVHLNPRGEGKSRAFVFEYLSLDALWPEMALHTRANDAEFQKIVSGRVIHASVDSGAIRTVDGKYYDPLQRKFSIALNGAKHVCIAPYDLSNAHATTGQALCHDRDWPDEKPPKFGLKRLGVDFKKYPDAPVTDYGSISNEDIFYAPGLGDEMRTLITCPAEEAKDSQYFIPHCIHEFIFKPLNARVSITYRRIYLKDWKEIQAALEQRLQSFIVELK